MAVTRINDADLEDIRVKKGLAMLSLTIDASAELAIPADWPTVLLMDPAGSAKTVLLPAEADSVDLMFLIFNTADGSEVLTVEEDSSTTAISTIAQNEAAWFHCDGTTWRTLVGGVT